MKKENLFLKMYAITSSLVLGFLLVSGFTSNTANQRFDEITVERINIVEPDGKLMMVISNRERQHPGMVNGENFEDRERPPGILFFNEEQDEVGGLIYYGNKKDGANLVLSIDQYKNDQVMQLMQYTNAEGDNRYGLQLWERDKDFSAHALQTTIDSLEAAGYNYRRKMEFLKEMNGGKPINEPRMFIGKNYNRETGLFLQDQNGVERLRFYIDENNSPRIEVLNEEGEIVRDILTE
ncbi:MAG: hypothetical protein QNK23_09235 [Crocinitomicaceae bacterium]|nr:hypothetical protein [Crocinitomicaceae bacterium]